MATTSQGSGLDLILDSGGSFHMCTIREHFNNYRACDVGMVRMANGAESRIAGIGSVQMRMFDGVVRTLTRVRHVPELRNNLIFWGLWIRVGTCAQSELEL